MAKAKETPGKGVSQKPAGHPFGKLRVTRKRAEV